MIFKQKTPPALKTSMQQRIRELARKTGKRPERLKTLLVMERFIERINQVFPENTILKGGLALEFQLKNPRTTKDIDIRAEFGVSELSEKLKEVMDFRPTPEDHLYFEIKEDSEHPKITGKGVSYEGYRYQVKVQIAGNTYACFGLDIAFQDPIYGEPIVKQGSDFFEKYDIPPITTRIYPPSTHLAEKLHAYSCPLEEGKENSRCKDIVDVLLLAELLDGMSSIDIVQAFELTFQHRATHPLPSHLSTPPASWEKMYLKIKEDNDLPWKDIDEVFLLSTQFLEPVLMKKKVVWSYERWTWL